MSGKSFSACARTKSETLTSLQSNFIVSSGFNRTQWCKIIRSRSLAESPSLELLKLSEILGRLYYSIGAKAVAERKTYYQSWIVEIETGQ